VADVFVHVQPAMVTVASPLVGLSSVKPSGETNAAAAAVTGLAEGRSLDDSVPFAGATADLAQESSSNGVAGGGALADDVAADISKVGQSVSHFKIQEDIERALRQLQDKGIRAVSHVSVHYSETDSIQSNGNNSSIKGAESESESDLQSQSDVVTKTTSERRSNRRILTGVEVNLEMDPTLTLGEAEKSARRAHTCIESIDYIDFADVHIEALHDHARLGLWSVNDVVTDDNAANERTKETNADAADGAQVKQ
jgi:hypothetical protein